MDTIIIMNNVMNINGLPFEALVSLEREKNNITNNYHPYMNLGYCDPEGEYRKMEFEKNWDRCYLKLKNYDYYGDTYDRSERWFYDVNCKPEFLPLHKGPIDFFRKKPTTVWIFYMKKPTFIMYVPAKGCSKYGMFFIRIQSGDIVYVQDLKEATIFYYNAIRWSEGLNQNYLDI